MHLPVLIDFVDFRYLMPCYLHMCSLTEILIFSSSSYYNQIYSLLFNVIFLISIDSIQQLTAMSIKMPLVLSR